MSEKINKDHIKLIVRDRKQDKDKNKFDLYWQKQYIGLISLVIASHTFYDGQSKEEMTNNRTLHLLDLINNEQNPELVNWAQSKLLEFNEKLILKLAHKIKNQANESLRDHVSIDDLFQAGNISLIKAVKTYNPDKNVKLSTYAYRIIQQDMWKEAVDSQMIKRPSRKTKENTSNKTPISIINLDDENSKLSIEDVSDTEISIIAKYSNNKEELLKELIERLPDRSQEILKYHYGYFDGKVYTLQEIGDIYKISKARVSQIIQESIEKLKKFVEIISK